MTPPPDPHGPDPHGQAALMLWEALVLLLIEEGAVSKERMVEAIDGVIEVKLELARTGEDPMVGAMSIGLLRDIVRSVSVAPRPGFLPTP